MLRLLCLTLPFVSTHGFGDSRLDACEQAGGISGFQGDLANLKKKLMEVRLLLVELPRQKMATVVRNLQFKVPTI